MQAVIKKIGNEYFVDIEFIDKNTNTKTEKNDSVYKNYDDALRRKSELFHIIQFIKCALQSESGEINSD